MTSVETGPPGMKRGRPLGPKFESRRWEVNQRRLDRDHQKIMTSNEHDHQKIMTRVRRIS